MSGTPGNDWFDKIDSVKIFPPIGIARVGNSEEGRYYGPEIPSVFDIPEGGFKDSQGAVKRQAARFRVYAFDSTGSVLGEMNDTSGFYLSWNVQVANKKPAWYTFMGRQQEGAFQPGYTTLRNPLVQPDLPPDQRDKLIIDSGIKTVEGPSATPQDLEGDFYGSKEEPTKVYLGETHTDDQGRLVFLAGRGYSHSIANEKQPYPLILTDFDSPDWVDDTCDGWIDVEVRRTENDDTYKPMHKARVIGTTPKFASGIYAPTTLYDVIEDVYEAQSREAMKDSYSLGDIEWYKDIWSLLQRPALLSWVNGQANDGHGPNGPGNFFDPEWQVSLSDNSEKNLAIRKGILGRMRLPETNSKYDQARAGQAYPYFMPWLSGDNGRTTAGDASTFSSITELQYDRLVKWSNGDFTVNPDAATPKYNTFSDIPLQEQPAALTRASLEDTIGAPLYPGIELSWNAELPETYNLQEKFTVADSVQPGDLTKFLSLPWQSDFYMCRSYWWPSARPDAIVTEDEYERVSKSFKPAEIAKKLTNRVPWERGIHQNYTDVYGDQPLFANTDMAKNWSYLGFVSLAPGQSPQDSGYLIYVEKQRGEIPREDELDMKMKLDRHRVPHGGGITLPSPDTEQNPITTVESLRTHLQKAMAIELATIPLYLFGMYSVKTPEAYIRDPRYNDPIVSAVRGVLAEEMLHLSLAGNVLLAVGGTPKLYDPDYIPSYSMVMPGRVPELLLELKALTKEHLESFVGVEKREEPDAKPEPDEYHSLGQFYDAIMEGMQYLVDQGVPLFNPDTAKYQFAPGLGYQAKIRDAGGSVIVTDLATANEALTTIIVQGEGGPGLDKGPFVDPSKLEKDHYDIFLDLMNSPTTWDVYPVRSNPTTYEYYEESKQIYQVSLAFDAAYCFLLLTIEKLWTIDNTDARYNLILGNMFGIMLGVLAPLAKFLVQQPIGDKGEHAAPCFCYYQFTTDGSMTALEQVQDEMQAAIESYVAVTAETPDQVAVNDYGAMLEALLPIQTSVNALIDLDTFKKVDRYPVKKATVVGTQNQGSKGFAQGY